MELFCICCLLKFFLSSSSVRGPYHIYSRMYFGRLREVQKLVQAT